MSNINQSFFDRVRYTLQHKSFSPEIIEEPIGWNEDQKEYARNEEYHGIFAKFSNALKFVGKSATLINDIRNIYGIQTELRLVKEERHPQTDVWTKSYDGYLDLSTWIYEKNQVSVKFNSGGLEEILKARESEEVELTRLTSIDGVVLQPIIPKTIEIEGRRIFLKSTMEIKSPDNNLFDHIESNDQNRRAGTIGFPLKIVNKSHEELSTVQLDSKGDELIGGVNMMFFYDSQVDRNLKIDLECDFTTDVYRDVNIAYGDYQVCLSLYRNDLSLANRIPLFSTSDNSNFHTELGSSNPSVYAPSPNPSDYVQPVRHHISFHNNIFVPQGYSLALESFIVGAIYHFDVSTNNIIGKLSIEEDSSFNKTTSKLFLAHDVADRLVQIMTGKTNIFKSDFLGRLDLGYLSDGTGSLTGITHGFYVRGFDAVPISTETDPNRFKPLTTSFKDFVTSFDAVWNVGLGIEKNGYSEKIVIEDLKYFYNKNVTIKLPNLVKNLKRIETTKHYFSGIEIGYDKGGTYEEAFGLDEYNGKSKFTTLISVVKQTFQKISTYRADSYGKEFCRRKQKSRYATQDTPYDEDKFLLDLKRDVILGYKERKWQDDFSQIPTGTYSPDTATELRFSPFNMLTRHGWQLAAGLVKYPSDYIRYGSSSANSQLKTKFIGANEYAENGNIVNSELQKARYVAEILEFDHTVDFATNQKLQGYTIFNGEKVFNFYGLIQIKTNLGIEKGWLMNLKPNKEGKWQLLKSNN